MSNILVVGTTGTIGAALFTHLQKNNTAVWGTAHHQDALAKNIFHINLLDDSRSWDFSNLHFDTVYLCAGVCQMGLCENDPIQTRKVNIDGMQALIRRLAVDDAFIVFLSTNQVFSGENPFECPTAVQQPQNEYGRQKTEMENWIKKHCPRFAIVRLTKVVEPNLALISNWINQLLNNQIVRAFHDMPLAPISLKLVVETLNEIGEKKQNGFYHISGAEDVSYFTVVEYLAKLLKCPASLVESVSALDNGIKKIFLPRFTTLDCSSTIALCGMQPPHFSEVLQECFNLEHD